MTTNALEESSLLNTTDGQQFGIVLTNVLNLVLRQSKRRLASKELGLVFQLWCIPEHSIKEPSAHLGGVGRNGFGRRLMMVLFQLFRGHEIFSIPIQVLRVHDGWMGDSVRESV